MDTLNKISVILAKRRKELNLSQVELAKILKVSGTTVEFIEQGRRYPSLAMLIHICKHLKLKIEVTEL